MPKRSPGSQNEDDINRRFGSRLRQKREMAGRSQTDVGNALGVSFQQIQKYENGTTSISLNRLIDVAEYLGTPMVGLLDGLDGRMSRMMAGFGEDEQAPYSAGDFIETGPLNKDKVALLTAFDRIKNPKVRRAVVSMVEALGTGSEAADPGDDDQPGLTE